MTLILSFFFLHFLKIRQWVLLYLNQLSISMILLHIIWFYLTFNIWLKVRKQSNIDLRQNRVNILERTSEGHKHWCISRFSSSLSSSHWVFFLSLHHLSFSVTLFQLSFFLSQSFDLWKKVCSYWDQGDLLIELKQGFWSQISYWCSLKRET